MSVCQSVTDFLSFLATPLKHLRLSWNRTRILGVARGRRQKYTAVENPSKKKVENFCEKNVEKHVVKCMGIFTSPRGDPYENDQKSPKITKITEITGTWGFTSVLPGSTGFTWVHKCAQGTKGITRVHTGSYGNTGTHTGAHRGSPFCVPPSAARIPTGAS